jgi:hypothetical protein
MESVKPASASPSDRALTQLFAVMVLALAAKQLRAGSAPKSDDRQSVAL